MNIITEIRQSGNDLHGVIVQEGRAASGGRSELFAPGSIQWPSSGIGILTEHNGEAQTRAFPHRTQDGKINIRATATDKIKAAIDSGKRFMSVEFRALEERTTKGGIREILSAFVQDAALVSSPEYDVTTAEIRTEKRRRVWL